MKSVSFKVVIRSLFILIFSVLAFGQQKPFTPIVDCNSYQFPTDDYYKLAGGGEKTYAREIYLKKFVEQCFNSSQIQQAKRHLAMALEERAESNLRIAKFYLKQTEEGKGGLKGAESRLRQITEKYSQFSKMDEVLFLLIKAHLIEKDMDEAKKYYRQLLDDFPFSSYVCEANKLFNSGQNNLIPEHQNTFDNLIRLAYYQLLQINLIKKEII